MKINEIYQGIKLNYGIWRVTRKISNIEKKRSYLCSIMMGFYPVRPERLQRIYFSDGNLYRKKISLEEKRNQLKSKLVLLTN
jgi:hypothetical protein